MTKLDKGDIGEFQQNRMSLEHLSCACDKFNVSDRAGAAIAAGVLKDYAIITGTDTRHVIDRSNLRRKQTKHREVVRIEEPALFSLVDGVYVDGRKDTTMILFQSQDGKYYRKIQLEEHYVIVGEPGGFYVSHVSLENGKGITIVNSIGNSIENTTLEEKLVIAGNDGTAIMTGAYKGAIHLLEERLNKPMQWAICLLLFHELPLRHVFISLDGETKSLNSFSGPTGKRLGGCI